MAAGRSIFENGVPQDNIAACAACHGPHATGRGEIPRLAGQLYPYVVKALSSFPKERGQNPAIHGPSFIMLPVAHSSEQEPNKSRRGLRKFPEVMRQNAKSSDHEVHQN